MALFEFSLLFFARGDVVQASRVGARTASMPGVAHDAVEHEIRKVLSPRYLREMQLEIDPGDRTGDVVVVTVRVPMSLAAPDLLWPIGYSLHGRDLYAETRMIKE